MLLWLAIAEAQAAETTAGKDLVRSWESQGFLAVENISLMEERQELQDSLGAHKKRLAKTQVGGSAIDPSSF